MKIGNIVWDAWIRRKRSINDIERKDLNILKNIMKYEEHKEDRKDYRKAYSQIEIECEVCKCTVRKCNLAKHILTKKHKHNLQAICDDIEQ